MVDIVFVCDTCAGDGSAPKGAGFAEALTARVSGGVEVRRVSCLNICDEPLALALRAPDKAAYLFAGVRPDEDLEDALALIGLYAAAADGVIEDARPAGRLRFCLKGRVPAI